MFAKNETKRCEEDKRPSSLMKISFSHNYGTPTAIRVA